jgi:hypothetical protein
MCIGFLYVGYRDTELGPPTELEIRTLFSGFAIEFIRKPTSEEEEEETRLGKCAVVHFAKWGECGEAMRVSCFLI